MQLLLCKRQPPVQDQCQSRMVFVAVVSKLSEGIEPMCSDTKRIILHCVHVCVLQGSACCTVLCRSTTARFVAFSVVMFDSI